ncbi:hypothetical protein DQ04_13151000 [Trypanosoma grayi]|uniref:hypothetical protein n=1 Tax=Trypanosoma grayi TaxID=71804 RepID=UPI0004F4482C|nr:hypothetical protein DQ04_13151000 [Trypanosoma grayi]KEG06594.1 hypothetical protein DQ04_13151000 [Trypanosoma grayi]
MVNGISHFIQDYSRLHSKQHHIAHRRYRYVIPRAVVSVTDLGKLAMTPLGHQNRHRCLFTTYFSSWRCFDRLF